MPGHTGLTPPAAGPAASPPRVYEPVHQHEVKVVVHLALSEGWILFLLFILGLAAGLVFHG